MPAPVSGADRKSPRPMTMGKTISFQLLSLDWPLRTITDSVQKKRHTRRVCH